MATPSLASSDNISVTFVNGRSSNICTWWSDFSGELKLYSTVAPGDSVTQNTFINHFWVVTDADSGDRLFEGYMTYDGQSVMVPDESMTDQPHVLRFINQGSESRDVIWLKPDGQEEFYDRVGGGDTFTVDTFVGHRWLLRDTDSGNLIRDICAGTEYPPNEIIL